MQRSALAPAGVGVDCSCGACLWPPAARSASLTLRAGARPQAVGRSVGRAVTRGYSMKDTMAAGRFKQRHWMARACLLIRPAPPLSPGPRFSARPLPYLLARAFSPGPSLISRLAPFSTTPYPVQGLGHWSILWRALVNPMESPGQSYGEPWSILSRALVNPIESPCTRFWAQPPFEMNGSLRVARAWQLCRSSPLRDGGTPSVALQRGFCSAPARVLLGACSVLLVPTHADLRR